MWKPGKTILILLLIPLLNACVSSQKYEARLDVIHSQNQSIADLQGKLKSTEAELERCRDSYQEVSLERDELSDANMSLRQSISDNSLTIRKFSDELREKDQIIFDLKTRAAELSEEKSNILAEKERQIAKLKGTYDDLVSELNSEIRDGEIVITRLRDRLSLSMVDRVLFDSGSATVKKEGKAVLERVADIIRKVSDKVIRVEGHTDNVPISSRLEEKFPTNWELSTARATNVVRYLQEAGDINPRLLSAAGYSEYRPVASNDTAEGRARNRRIEIVLVPPVRDRVEGPEQ